MNLSPLLVARLSQSGIEAAHWSRIGACDATDSEIMAWARQQGYSVLTHDLDFGALLHATEATGPSVIQFRDQNIEPSAILETLLSVFKTCSEAIEEGALITIQKSKIRVTILPLSHRIP